MKQRAKIAGFIGCTALLTIPATITFLWLFCPNVFINSEKKETLDLILYALFYVGLFGILVSLAIKASLKR